MGDSALAVQKRVIQAMTHLYRVALVWISKAKALTEDMEAVWSVVGKIKGSSQHQLFNGTSIYNHTNSKSLTKFVGSYVMTSSGQIFNFFFTIFALLKLANLCRGNRGPTAKKYY